jgi:uncharacterized iron-regulated membrane protein
MAAFPSPRLPWRRILRFLHLWVGLIRGVPLVLIGITGSVLVFEHELDALLNPELHRASAGEPRPIDDIVAAARSAVPAGSQPMMFVAPESSGDAATVRFAPPGRNAPGPGGLQVFVDPESLSVLGALDSSAGVLRQIFMLHANLLVRDRSGREAVGWLGVVMLALGISGMVLWWPTHGRWGPAFRVKWSARGMRFHRELHGAVGIWSWAVFMVVSFTGVYIVFPQSVGAGLSAMVPTVDRPPVSEIRVTPAEGVEQIGFNQAAALAQADLGDARLRTVGLPMRPDQPVRVGLAHADADPGAPAITVFVDPWTAHVLEVRDPRSYSVGESVMAWQRPLHYGIGLGWLWRIPVFLSGLLPLLFVVTGFYLWLLKRRARRTAVARRVPAE